MTGRVILRYFNSDLSWILVFTYFWKDVCKHMSKNGHNNSLGSYEKK